MPSIKFLNTGSDQTFTIPSGLTSMTIKAWGVAGGPQAAWNSWAGAGGYSEGILDVTSGQILRVMVGSIDTLTTTTSTYGGGAGVGSIFSTNFGGNGGGVSGNDTIVVSSNRPVTAGTGGTQTAGGAGGINSVASAANGLPGISLQGGQGGPDNGGGGGSGASGSDNPSEIAGAGGSGFINTTILRNAVTLATSPITVPGVINPPNTSDPDYIAGIGVANGGGVKGSGLVVFSVPYLVLNKSVDKTSTTSGEILNYTIAIRNTGPGTVSNIIFLDTIPGATTLVPNSLNQDGTSISGNPYFPGVTLPNALGENQVTTITFSVTVTGTLPNPIRNQGIASYGAGQFRFISNQVVTTITGSANLAVTKTVDKPNALIGDILTYNIVTVNTGTLVANNVTFSDTIPNGTTLVLGSFRQGTTSISGSPNPPGVNLPNSIAPGQTSTITFQVTVTSTPNPNPIPNNASMTYNYFNGTETIAKGVNTNTVNTSSANTLVSFADLSSIRKLVDKSFADCADILNYTIVIPNLGTLTAQNVVFKDTIPNGTVFVPSSVFVNGVLQSGATPVTGVTLPNIGPSSTVTLTFKVQVQC